MAKKQTNKEEAYILSMKNTLISDAKKKLGKSAALTTTEFNESIRGISLDNILPLQYLLGNDIIPLDCMLTLVGVEATSKSGTAFGVFARQFLKHNGFVILIETEAKVDPLYIQSLIGNDKWYNERFCMIKGHSIDEGFKQIKYAMDWQQKNMPDIPTLIIMDSLGMLLSKEAQDKIKKTNEVERTTGLRNAGIINDHLRDISNKYIDNSNCTLLVINHQSQDTSFKGRGNKMKESGGTKKEFAWTYKIELRQGWKKDAPPMHIDMGVSKNALGPLKNTRLYIPRPEEKGKLFYDWGSALVNMIARSDRTPGITENKRDLNKILDIVQHKTEDSYKSKIMGVEGLTAFEMGKKIIEDPKLINLLKKYFKITVRKKIEGK